MTDPPETRAVSPADGGDVFCAKCRASMPPEAAYCPKCGAPRMANEPTRVLPPVPPVGRVREEAVYAEDSPRRRVSPPPPRSWNTAMIVLGVLGLFLLVLVVLLALLDEDDSGPPEPTTTIRLTPTTVRPAPAPTRPRTTARTPATARPVPATTAPPTTIAPTPP
ncbi:MAG: zinc ribbon domain-containing protein [Actinomycetota bacterium]|nr:zinc ribbon domain-containing protein [Actinomycetota bacterium]